MNTVDFIQGSVHALHQALLEDMHGLSEDHLAWRPQIGANPIGYIFLHYVRTEDASVQGLQGLPILWDAEKFSQALSDVGRSVGGDTIDNAARIPLADSLAYAHKVMDRTRQFLGTLDDSKLDISPDPNRPRRTVGVTFRAFVLAHGWWHLGEIKYLKGLQGMPAPI